MPERTDAVRVLVTGANSGLGYAVAQELASTGRHVVIAARSGTKADDAVARMLADPDYPVVEGNLSTVVLDLADTASIRAAAESVRRGHGALDVLINCAGVRSVGDDADVRATYRFVFETNVFGAADLVEQFLPLLRASDRPDRRIVHVTSGAGQIGLALSDHPQFNAAAVSAPAYRTSKAALNMLSAVHAMTLQPDGIISVVAAPGPTQTRFSASPDGKSVHEGAQPILRAAVAGDPRQLNGTLVADEATEYGW